MIIVPNPEYGYTVLFTYPIFLMFPDMLTGNSPSFRISK